MYIFLDFLFGVFNLNFIPSSDLKFLEETSGGEGFLVMSGPPRVRSMNIADPESRPVLVPAGNKAWTIDGRKTASKPVKKSDKALQETQAKEKKLDTHSIAQFISVPAVLEREDHHQAVLNLSMNDSCSSDASSTDSSTHSCVSSSGEVVRRVSVPLRKKQSGLTTEKVEKVGTDNVSAPDAVLADTTDGLEGNKRCHWITPNTASRL